VQAARSGRGTPHFRSTEDTTAAKATQADVAVLKSRAAQALQGAVEMGMLRSALCTLAESDKLELVEEKNDQEEAARASARTVGTAVSSDMLAGTTVACAFALVGQIVSDTRHGDAGDLRASNASLHAAQDEANEEEYPEDDFLDESSDESEGSESDYGSCSDLGDSSDA